MQRKGRRKRLVDVLGEGAQEFTVFSKYDETRVMVRGADIFPYPLTGP